MPTASRVESLSSEALSAWKKAIDAAKQVRKDIAERYDWQGNIDRYAPKNAKKTAGDVNIGADFADVERKAAALFYDTPAISCLPDQPTQPLTAQAPSMDGQPVPPPVTLGQVALIHQDVLNELLGEGHTAFKGTAGKAILDVLLPAGVGPVRVGYTATTIDTAVPTLDQMGQPVLGLDGAPEMQTVPVPIHEKFWISRISPMALLLPKECTDTNVNNASWIGYEFSLPESQVRAEYGIPASMELPKGDETKLFGADEQAKADSADPPVSGVYLEYRAAHFGKHAHPEAIYVLVLIEGAEQPVKHGPSAHQTFSPEGRLTPDSLRGFSILPLWTRDLPDSAWVPSDSTITGPLTKEINKYREQAIRMRDNTRNVVLYDTESMTPEVKDKIDAGDVNTFVGVKGGDLAAKGAAGIMAQVATAQLTRDSYLGQDYMMSDREKILGISSNQQGAQTSGKKSATEVSTIQRNTEARFNKEQARVREWTVTVVRALDTLVLRYGDARFASMLVGPQRGQVWATHKAALAGGYRYEIKTDSGKYLDAEASRRQKIQFYQMVRQDPMVNPRPVIMDLLTAFGIDPGEGIVEPKPATPPPPQAAFSFRGDDLNPLNPQFLLVVKIAQQGGWQIAQTDIDAAKKHAQEMLTANSLVNVAQATEGQPVPNEKHGDAAAPHLETPNGRNRRHLRAGDSMTICDCCGALLQIGDFPFCPHAPTQMAVHGDDVPGGFWAENGFDTPRKFYSHSEHEAALAARGLEIRAKYAGEHDRIMSRSDAVPAEKFAWAAHAMAGRTPTKRNWFATEIPEADRGSVEITETMVTYAPEAR